MFPAMPPHCVEHAVPPGLREVGNTVELRKSPSPNLPLMGGVRGNAVNLRNFPTDGKDHG